MRASVAFALFASLVLGCSDDATPISVDARVIDATVVDGPTIDTPDVDAPSIDAIDVDAPSIDAIDVDAPAIDGPAIDGPDVDAGTIDAIDVDAPAIDAAVDAAVVIDAPPGLPGETCQVAETITAPANPGTTSVTATTLAYTSNYNPTCAGASAAGPDRVHTLTIPANTRLVAAVVPTAATFDPGIYVIAPPPASCDAATIACLASNDAGGDGETDAITFDNTTAAPRDVLILIDGFRATGDAYTLNLTFSAVPATLPGDTCQLATPITIPSGMTSTSVASTTLGYANNYAGGPCTGFNANGPDRAHAFSIPPGQRLTATVMPTVTTFDPGIYVVAAPAATCDAVPLVCLAGEDNGGDGAADALTVDNPSTTATLDVFIVIDTFRAAGNTYSLSVALAPLP